MFYYKKCAPTFYIHSAAPKCSIKTNVLLYNKEVPDPNFQDSATFKTSVSCYLLVPL